MLPMDFWLGLTTVLRCTEPQKPVRIVNALQFGASRKPPRFNITAPPTSLQTNKILILQASAAEKNPKYQTIACVLFCWEALTRSWKLVELALGRRTHLHRGLVVHPPLHISGRMEQKSLPPFGRIKNIFPPWKGKTQKEKNYLKCLKPDFVTVVYIQRTNHSQILVETWGHLWGVGWGGEEEMNSAVHRGKHPHFPNEFSQAMLHPTDLTTSKMGGWRSKKISDQMLVQHWWKKGFKLLSLFAKALFTAISGFLPILLSKNAYKQVEILNF